MRRPLALLFIVAAAMLSLLGTAEATPASGVAVPGLSCPAGNLCAWPVIDGSASRCSWSNADNDWRSTPVVCSWSSSRTVKALYNNGTSPDYIGVCVYRGPNYTEFDTFIFQGGTETFAIGRLMRSHKWIRSNQGC